MTDEADKPKILPLSEADQLLHPTTEADITPERIDAFMLAMSKIKAVLNGTLEKPGGATCVFPHCMCNSPWELCEHKASARQSVVVPPMFRKD